MDAVTTPPAPHNEPVLGYAPGSRERASLERELIRQADTVVEIPCVVDGVAHRTGRIHEVRMPCERGHVLARAHLATPELVAQAVQSSERHRRAWREVPWEERAAIFLRAADLLAGPWRDRMNAATMLGQGKSVHQAEIDAACELIDFWRFNVSFARQLYALQPESPKGAWNRLDHRPLEGFVFAVAPFNFTSIALNLPTAPALLGNVAVWKPATTSLLSSFVGHELLEAAGLPPGVIQFLPGHGADVGEAVLGHPWLAGLHFTGSSGTFHGMWRTIGQDVGRYRTFPRIVGETGGKNFVLVHPSADPQEVAVAVLRGGFEYQGQKCSAASRVYLPRSLRSAVLDRLVAMMDEMRQGDSRDLANFVNAVIDERAFKKHGEYQALARAEGRVLRGGTSDGAVGWYVHPTLVELQDPKHRLLREEIFGPVVSAYTYEDAAWEQVLDLVDGTSPYALTGAVFARDRGAVGQALRHLRDAAGNTYINDKPTGAVVGQQPFGGARASGTNDKAGSLLNLLRWVSPRTIKETLVPPTDWRYPFLGT